VAHTRAHTGGTRDVRELFRGVGKVGQTLADLKEQRRQAALDAEQRRLDKERADFEKGLLERREKRAEAAAKRGGAGDALAREKFEFQKNVTARKFATEAMERLGIPPGTEEFNRGFNIIFEKTLAGETFDLADLPPDILQLRGPGAAGAPVTPGGISEATGRFIAGEPGAQLGVRLGRELGRQRGRAEAGFEEGGLLGAAAALSPGSMLLDLLRRGREALPEIEITGPQIPADASLAEVLRAPAVRVDVRRRRVAPTPTPTPEAAARISGVIDGIQAGVPLEAAKLSPAQVQFLTEGVTVLSPATPGARQANILFSEFAKRPTERNETKLIQQLENLVTQQQQLGRGGINVQEFNLMRDAIARFKLANLLNLSPLQAQ